MNANITSNESFASLLEENLSQMDMTPGTIFDGVVIDINYDKALVTIDSKQTIDIIGMLEQKTVGNLSPEESGLVRQILFQLRMQYVEISKSKK